MKTAGIKKGILLFEVAFVVLLVSVISLFMFRGYGLFIKTAKKSMNYLKLALVSERQIWELQEQEANNEITNNMETSGDIDSDFSWGLVLEDTGYDNFKQGTLRVESVKAGESLDTIIYLNMAEE